MVRENYKHEPKAQVWAFMLWKNAQLKKAKEGENAPTSWIIYQRWCKLNTEEKDAWVAAGQTIQSFTKISAAKVQEIKAKTQAPIVKNKIAKSVSQDGTKSNDDDPLEEGEIHVKDSGIDSKGAEKGKKGNDTPKKTPFKPVQINSDVTVALKKSPDLRKALRTAKNDIPEEAVVERILSRRFNHKKKCMEYFVKWESLNDTENTWEPKQHLEKCKTLLDEFDKVFNKPKSGSKLTKHIDESHSEHSEAEEIAPGRPQRTSKQKALNQVKVWCGDITEGDEASGKRKSFSDDDDSSDSFEKKIKLEEETDSSDDERPSVTIRRVVKAANSVNGMTKKLSETGFATSTPQRVVRVSQKQLPSLSSGVYIMSKTEGIIKLDSNTPPIGSPLLRVGPKIGQTHIKMVKKETGSPSNIRTPVKVVPKLIKTSEARTSLTASKTLTKVSTLQRKTSATPITKPPIRIIESNVGEKIDLKKQKIEDEDSDGLEELDFPTDLPLPSPDSPPGEFTLCPLTGKILGKSGEPMEQEEAMENTSLDILVKQAVAELPDVDMDASTSNTKDEDSDKSTETASAAPTISISVAPVDAVNVPSVGSVNVTSIVSISTASDASSSTSPTATIITTPIAAAKTPIASISVVAAPTTTATSTIPARTPATSISVTSKISGQSTSAISTPITSNSKIATKDDIEERLTPNTIEKSSLKEGLKTVVKSRPLAAGTSILNAALTNRASPNPNRVGPPKRLLSTTPHTVRQKVTTVHRSPINRPTVPRPSPNTTIIHKLTPTKNRTVLPKAGAHPEPMLKRTSNVTTYKPANVARRIGNTTIYKTSEKPQISSIKTAHISSPAPIVTTVTPTVQPTLLPTTQTVINMPLLTTDEEPATSENIEPLNEIETLPNLPADTGLADLSTFSLPDSETPLLITGDDGTIYQVAGHNEEGQTILISEGPDGQQQCVLVSSETTTEEGPVLMMDSGAGESEELEQTLMVTAPGEEVETEDGDGEESQVVAQIIKADPPSPGGTRKVVLMLPDGNLMMTDVTAEQYAALELDK